MNLNSNKVYIILPVYNVEKYLDRCLNSIFNQTYKNIFLICVNDGSTDNSLCILRDFSKCHNNMVVINKKNGGLSSARNAALDYIKCFDDSYLVFIDSDDFISFDYIETLVNYIEKDSCDLVVTSYIGFLEENEIAQKMPKKIKTNIYKKDTSLFKLIKGDIMCHAHCKIYKSILWKNQRFPEKILFMEDQYIMPIIFDNAANFVVSNYRGYFYQFRAGSLCQSKMTPGRIIDALLAYKINFERSFKVSKKYSKKIRNAALNQFSKIYLMMYPRVSYCTFTDEQIAELNKIDNFLRANHAILKMRSDSIRTFLKKICFIMSKKLYLKVYSRYLKDYEK